MEPQHYPSLSSHKRRALRQLYVIEQQGLCHHCKRPLALRPTPGVEQAKINKDLFPPNFFDHPVHLHHNHNTGMTIGAVHARCNAYLWQYKGE
ncbi:hypothetical protein EVC27_031 [Rhizobium phage RHph_I1_6]|uniref:Uncharacterized protein n=1 Tax=Rhizobium phage RHph_I1_6 TaxID=2509728 RepID=A0A7S5RFF8_9CAUD|nr:hypothetical protein PP745_gp031 [Rhizobium phage RHph_I1_6]QIG76556.1 hypothetical protein EVC27_031 [Rhizobium phage RHph_I1_6]